MRILAILYCYPPLLFPAAMCYLKLMAGLVENDVEVEILTIDPESFDSPGPVPLDETLLKVVPEAITNHVVWSPENGWPIRLVKRLDPGRRLTYPWLEPKKREWIGPALRKLRKLDLGRFDLILSCSQPHANHLLGLELKKQTGLPWIAYFSDPWTDNPYQSFGSERVRQHHRTLEDLVLRRADLVLYTSDEMRQLVVDRHSVLQAERTGILPHAFVPGWYGTTQPHRLDGPPVRLLHTGSFYGPRTPLPLIDALRRVDQRVGLGDRLRIDSYGGIDDRYRQLVTARGLGEVFSIHGFVAYLESLALMKQCDGLLLVDAALTSTAESVFLPSKLVDYLGAGRPVIAVTPANGTTARVVAETGGTVVPIEDPSALDRILLEIVEEGRVPGSPGADAIGRYDYREVGRSLLRLFQELRA